MADYSFESIGQGLAALITLAGVTYAAGWLKEASAADTRVILCLTSSGATVMIVQQRTGLKLSVTKSGGSRWTTDAACLTAAAWQFVEIDVSGSTPTVKVNGTSFAVSTDAAGPGADGSQITFGSRNSGGFTSLWTGLLGPWGLATSNLAWDGYNFVQVSDASVWWAFYRMREGTGGTVDNAEGTAARDLTLTGTVWSLGTNLGNGWSKRT